MKQNPPEWVIVCSHDLKVTVARVGFLEIPRGLVKNLPDYVEGRTVFVCQRSFWLENSANPDLLPDGDVVAVRRLGNGQFAYYMIGN